MSFLTGNALGGCACGCSNGILSVIALVPYNFYQKFKPGTASNSSGIPTSTTIGQPDLTNNTSKFLRRIVTIDLYGGSLTGVLDTQYDRTTGAETTNRDDSIPGGNQMGWYLTYAGIVAAGYFVTHVVASDRRVVMQLGYMSMGVRTFLGTATIEYLDQVDYFMAADDATALLSNVTLLANGYTVIDPTTLRYLGAATPVATTYAFSGNSIVICPPTLVVEPGHLVYVNWPNANPVQLVENTKQSDALIWGLTSGKQRTVAARGIPGFIFISGYYDERAFRWPPATLGAAKVFEPQSNSYYDQQNNQQKVDFVCSMKTVSSFSAIQDFVEAAYDPSVNLWSSGSVAKPMPALGQIIFEPSDLGAAFGTLAVAWDMPTNAPQSSL